MPEARPSPARVSQLLLAHRATLYGYILACVRNHADVEDILQEVSEAVVASGDRLRDEIGFLPWAREIARRRVLAHFRNGRRERSVDPEVAQALSDAAHRLDERQADTEREAALAACLGELPERSRQMILMRYNGAAGDAGGLARKFGRSVQSIYAHVKRIKVALRECVERRLGPSP